MNERTYAGGVDRLRDPNRISLLEVPRVVELAGEGIPVTSVLDIGIGSGVFAEAFAAKGARIGGVDLMDEMLSAARQYVPSADLRVADAGNLPFGDASYDLVFMGLLLHEVDSVETALREALRVARYRVAALEWPYRQQEIGPPLGHRLNPEVLGEAATQACLATVEEIGLANVVLYRIQKG